MARNTVSLDELLSRFSDEDRADIHRMAQELGAEVSFRRLRDENHISQRQLAASAGVSQSTISHWEKHFLNAKLSSLQTYFKAMNVTAKLVIEPPSGKPFELPIT